MPNSCCAYGCKNKYSSNIPRHFFGFPLNNEKILKLWVQAIRRKNFKPTKYTKLCSDHFKKSDYLVRPGAYVRKLKPDAVPSIFPNFPLQPKIPKLRTPRKRLIDEQVSDVKQSDNANFSSHSQTKIPKLQRNRKKHEQVTNTTLIESVTDPLIAATTLKVQTNKKTHEQVTNNTLTESAIDPLILATSKLQTNKKRHEQVTNITLAESAVDLLILTTTQNENDYRIVDQSSTSKQVKPHKQDIQRRNEKINDLKELIQDLRSNNLLNEEKGNTLSHLFQGVSLEIFENQPKNRKRTSKGRRYTEELKKFCLTLNYYSPEAYCYCTTLFNLPHPSSIRIWTTSVNAEPGFFKEVFLALQNFPQQDKDCTLILGGMPIRKQIISDPKSKKFIGYCDYGNELEIEDPETPATEALVFMLCSLKGKWKWPIGYVFQNKLDSTVQAELIRTALILAGDAGLRVWGITCDGSITNFTTMEILGCKLFVESHDEMKCNFKHPCKEYEVHFIPDASHMLKLARNALGTCKYFEIETNKIEWTYVEKLHSLGTLKLSSEWERNKMKVKMATRTLSAPVADALEFLMNQEIADFENCEDTITFIRIVDRIFEFLNVSNPLGDGFKKPLYFRDLLFLECRLVPLIEYLFKLNYNGQPLIKSRRRTFIFGLSASIKSVLRIARELLIDNLNFNYLLPYRFSQDHIELLFARLRRRCGCTNNPNQIQFKIAMKQLLKDCISPSPSAYVVLGDDPVSSIFDFKWNPLHVLLDGNEVFLDKLEQSEYFSDLNISALETNREIGDLKNNIIYYIAGYVVNKITEEIHCESCMEALTEDNYCYSRFTTFFNRGGLTKVSKSVFLLIQEADKQFQFHNTYSFKELSKSLIIKKIVAECYRKFSLDSEIFPNLNCPNVPMEARPHKLCLILIVIKKYLKVRFFSYRKFFSKNFATNPVSRRQEVSKSIWFSNC